MLGRGTRQGETVPGQVALHGLRLLRRHAARILQEGHRHHRRAARQADAGPSRRSSRTSGRTRTATYNVRCLVKRLQRIDKEMSGEARELFAGYIPDGDMRTFASDLPGKIADDFTATMKLLRDPAFQDLLVNYPRPGATFIVAMRREDTVSSAWLIRGADGKEYKPEDYLTAFARFVRDNPEQIEAIRILLNRPADWSTDALSELQQKLAPPGALHRGQSAESPRRPLSQGLVDIISMVKHAARDGRAAADRRGARRARHRKDDGRPAVHRGATEVAGPHPRPSGREPVNRSRRF